VLGNKIGNRTIEPYHKLQNPWEAPFFYSDSRHVFYVNTKKSLVPLPLWPLYYGSLDNVVNASISSLIMAEYEPPGPGPYEFGLTGLSNSTSMKRFVSEDAYINKALAMTNTVHLDGAEIGPSGHVVNALQKQ